MRDLSKLNQSQLERMLDQLEAQGICDGPEYEAIDAAINTIVDLKNKTEEEYAARKDKVKEKMKELFEEIERLKKTDVMIEHFGQQFYDDYNIENGNTVIS